MTTQSDRPAQSDEREISRLVTVASQENRRDVYAGKRRWRRYSTGMKLEAVFDRADTSDAFPVTMHNVSEIGLAFWAKREIEPGADVYLREFSDDDDRVWVGAHVTHCTSGIRGFLIGAKFHHPLASDDLEPVEQELVMVGEEDSVSDPLSDPSSGRRGLLGWLGWGRKDGQE